MTPPDANNTVGATPGSAPAGITNAASCPTSAFSLLPGQAIQSHRQNVEQFPCVHGTDGVFQQAEKDFVVDRQRSNRCVQWQWRARYRERTVGRVGLFSFACLHNGTNREN